MDNIEEMHDLPAVLFPHVHPSEYAVRKILTLFRPLIIFQPWFMEPPAFLNEEEYDQSTEIRNPPSEMKPDEDFQSLLSEYLHWIRHNQDKSYTEILKADQLMERTEKSTWEIRQMLRLVDQDTSSLEKDQTIRWHLILHLAQEIENQHLEADQILNRLKQKHSPLDGIVEEEGYAMSLFRDLPQFRSESLIDEYHRRQIFEAWFALFGGYLTGNELLITLDRHVMDYVSEFMKEPRSEDDNTHESFVDLRFPDLSHHPLENLAEIKKKYLIDKKWMEVTTLISELRTDPGGNLIKLDTLSKQAEGSYPWKLSQGTLDIRVQYLSPLSESDYLQGNWVLKELFNKTIICIE